MSNKILSSEITSVSEENRILRFVTSTEAQDRDGDIIEVDGWDLKNYLKNPVVLFGHDHRGLPVGKTVNIEKDSINKKLIQDIQFPTKDEYAFADTVYRLTKAGYLKTTSVGFIGIEHEPMLDDRKNYIGRRYTKQELLETSIVPVPSNPEALLEARSKGVISEEELKLFEGSTETEKTEKTEDITPEIKTIEVTQVVEKLGAILSAKNKEVLTAIHANLKTCHDMMTKFLNPEELEEPEKSTKGVEAIVVPEVLESDPENPDINLDDLVDVADIDISPEDLNKALNSIFEKKINQIMGGN